MDTLKCKQILVTAARLSQNEWEKYSKEEIKKKINEIKYLATQKKIPKLTLRKEIIHLENKLNSLYEMEKIILKQKRYESQKIASLRKQVGDMKKRINQMADHNLQKKVEKLNYLLGECVSKHKTGEEIKMEEKKVMHDQRTTPTMRVAQQAQTNVSSSKRLDFYEQRLRLLKHELLIKKELEKNPTVVTQLEEKLTSVEDAIRRYRASLGTSSSSTPVSHTLMFSAPNAIDNQEIQNQTEISEELLSMEKELPIPPPPKMEQEI